VSRDQRTSACRCRITLGELATQLGVTDDHVGDRAVRGGFVVAPDWANRPSVAVADAYAVAVSIRSGIRGAQQAQGGG
jgi:hypothetical protein